ncbi:MAG: 28S ribosomal protein S5, mitochondrial [Phylliscum demangeonii]|nr:MAG: 28S ribosomal protein S5, mitochondrial [Phylliscum demangeonii]
MSGAGPGRCLLCRARMPRLSMPMRPPARTRWLHHSAPRAARPARRQAHLAPGAAPTTTTAADFPPYTAAQKARLAETYTAGQLAAIEAGEAAISREDLATQAEVREDGFMPQYLDDFADMHPIVDRAVQPPESNYDPALRYKTEDEIFADYAHLYRRVDGLPDAQAEAAIMQFEAEQRWTVGKEAAERAPRSYLAPEMPRIKDPEVRYARERDGVADPAMFAVLRETGFTPQDLRRFRVKTLVIHEVSNQTRLGKIQTIYMLSVAGDGHGLLGLGEGKAVEFPDARRQSLKNAVRNMQPVHRYEQRTIYGDVQAKVGASVVQIFARPPGFGVRCQQHIFEMCRCAGISDLAARTVRSRNPMNVVKATYAALRSQRLPEDIARGRGLKLVDVRKVYYGGQV